MTYVAMVAALVAFAIGSKVVETWNRLEFIAVAFVLVTAVALIQRRFIAHLATLRKAHPDKRLKFPLEWDTTQIPKIKLEDAFTKRSVSTAWHCRSCREQNPGEFELCWKCKRDRKRNGA